ncbi:hypothetical protein ES703_115954 [subsurface metagenome]
MKIDEAKRIIGNIKRCDIPKEETAKWEALDLGLEALREVKKARQGDPALDGELLPNETEE